MTLATLVVVSRSGRSSQSVSSSSFLASAIALAEWLLGQAGEYDDYKQQHVVRLLAFEFHNSSRGGTSYRTIQLRDPADLNSARPPAAGSMPQQAHLQAPNPADDHGDLPF